VDLVIADVPERSRYEALEDDVLAGVAEYLRAERPEEGEVVVFTHTVVDADYEGRGVGGALARFALDDARRRGARVVAQCPFVRGWLERHPEYDELVWSPPGSTARD
jgi:predicted GNAT family acetyltransferase